MMANQEEEQQQQHLQVTMIKGKRTKRPRITVNSSGDDTCRISTSSSTITALTDEEEDMANCLILLAQGASKIHKLTDSQPDSQAVITVSAARTSPATTGMYVYECKTCNRSFSSFQALGGHRASHKKPKAESPPTASALSLSDEHRKHQDRFESAENSKINKVEDLGLSLQIACNSSNTLSVSNNNNNDVITNNNNKSNKVHACAICGAEFSSGQALGGHMRRHRPINTNSGSPPAQSASPPAPAPRNLLCLDLNLPADEQEEQQPESSKFMFATSEKTLVFAASLVDCRY